MDSTNIVKPEASVITNIGLDHTQFLGTTIPQIASEKAGIIKENTPVICGKMLEEAVEVIKRVATQKNTSIHKAVITTPTYISDLKGDYQKENIQTVLKTIEIIQSQKRFHIQEPHIKAGLANVTSNTGLRGRYELLSENPKIIADGGHNAAGIKVLLTELKNENYSQLRIVWSMVSDKNVSEVFSLLPKDAIYYFCESSVPRAMKITDLIQNAEPFGFTFSSHSSVKEALLAAKKESQKNDLTLVTGSFFTVADALSK